MSTAKSNEEVPGEAKLTHLNARCTLTCPHSRLSHPDDQV